METDKTIIWQIANSLGLLFVGSTLSFLVTWYWYARDRAVKKSEELQKRLVDVEGKLALVAQAVVPISTAFQAMLIKELTHYHTPECDDLLARVDSLTVAERGRLAVLLDERTRDMGDQISESERGAASILPEIMRRARLESAALGAAQKLDNVQVISIVVGVPNPTTGTEDKP